MICESLSYYLRQCREIPSSGLVEICYEESGPDEIKAVSCLAFQKIAKACFPITTRGSQTDTHMLYVKDSSVIHTLVFDKASSGWSSHEGGLWFCLSGWNLHVFALCSIDPWYMSVRAVHEKLHMAVSRLHSRDHNQDTGRFHIVLIDCLWQMFVCNWEQTANLDPFLSSHVNHEVRPHPQIVTSCMDVYIRDEISFIENSGLDVS